MFSWCAWGISPAKVREKPPDNAENRGNEVWREGKFPSRAENAAEMRRWTTFTNIYTPDDRNSRNDAITGSSYVTSNIKSFILVK